MRPKQLFDFYLPILGIVLIAGIGGVCLLHAYDYRTQERQLLKLAQEIDFADSIQDNGKAVRAYESLSSSFPEIQIRILQRQWTIALDLVGRIQRSKYNRALEKEVPALFESLLAHLDLMRDRCGMILTDSGHVADELLWQVHNIDAAVRLLAAFATLETEGNWPKVQGMIRDALAALKRAIESVDKIAGAQAKNIPRWNLELLYHQQYVEKFSLFNPENQNRMDLNENLEMLIPERGGYAPGEPADRSIKK